MIPRLLLALGLTLAASSVFAKCADTRVDLRGDWGSATFSVEIVDTEAERAVGLMNRPKLPASSGMLFVYDHPQRVGFWMENTLIPLDMVFVGSDGVVRKVHENAVPLDRSLILGGDDIQYVLEINGGMSSALGIAVGSQLRHPVLDQASSVWSCTDEPPAAGN